MKIQLRHSFEEIISTENLLLAWREFLSGKRNKPDVQQFALHLSDNILQLHEELANFSYRHGGYHAFNISDPKPRNIHKASVRDRVLHHAIYRLLYPFFDRTFIADSFSCRMNKGVHKALGRFREFGRTVSKNHTRTLWVLKLDIKKFFASIDHEILFKILQSHIPDRNIVWLLQKVIQSFCTRQLTHDRGLVVKNARGLPLGNLTSQLFCNIYMNEFDQFVKHKLKAKYYIRYADDFVILSADTNRLVRQIDQIRLFLKEKLSLELHPNKIFLKTLASGMDFLGWVNFPDHRVLRSASRRRMVRRLKESQGYETLQSYLGLLGHGNAYKLRQKIIDQR